MADYDDTIVPQAGRPPRRASCPGPRFFEDLTDEEVGGLAAALASSERQHADAASACKADGAPLGAIKGGRKGSPPRVGR